MCSCSLHVKYDQGINKHTTGVSKYCTVYIQHIQVVLTCIISRHRQTPLFFFFVCTRHPLYLHYIGAKVFLYTGK